jgi:hypothetical protein
VPVDGEVAVASNAIDAVHRKTHPLIETGSAPIDPRISESEQPPWLRTPPSGVRNNSRSVEISLALRSSADRLRASSQ